MLFPRNALPAGPQTRFFAKRNNHKGEQKENEKAGALHPFLYWKASSGEKRIRGDLRI
jgi:hypothetical protein